MVHTQRIRDYLLHCSKWTGISFTFTVRLRKHEGRVNGNTTRVNSSSSSKVVDTCSKTAFGEHNDTVGQTNSHQLQQQAQNLQRIKTAKIPVSIGKELMKSYP